MKSPVDGYDFIVVGGGSAGCVIASRLSENGGARVLLLEAGSEQSLPAMAVPSAWPTLVRSSASWGEFTVVQAATGTAALLPRGRGLGGSSAINAMGFLRGHRSSYDAWVAAGAEGWGFDDLLPYFKRSENTAGRDLSLRGVDGPLSVAPAASPNPVLAACLEAAVETGYRRASDISGGLEEGFGLTDLNIVDGRRQSAADAYLTAFAANRPNLDIVTDALVHRVRIEHGRCTGVEYSTAADTVTAHCSGEVVLTAGSIGSAQLLMVSGIGPQAHLREVGVEVVTDLPGVGANLHDHPIANVVYGAAQPIPAARYNHAEIAGLLRSDPALDAPDLQMVFIDAPGHVPNLEQGYTIAVSVMLPRSRGTVRLAGAGVDTAPVLDPNYYGDDHDLTTMVTGLRLAREIGRASALDPWRGQEVGPGLDDDAGLRAYVRETLASYCHPVGTCRIGRDEMAVVDTDLRVHGVSGLRVADGSVIPSIPSANTNATVYAIAERAAELIGS
ncbi:GMC family oxidoreductase [Streptosporangium sp. 'caverna']|uniref:GMC family oxidoreductase n=1 Tax=Streptosporangium sp. 'caverna' TaxID=2202249 RepID=UPI000D7DD8A6|nr:GMC family oxidoreductase N-terminal domain-containing protein [Streptosporangium sp. 'caverna']AWS47645.1 choline dehydrogenase [Streptosporangium sp. 'caverna']